MNAPAARSPDPSKNTRPDRSSYDDPDTGVNESGVSSFINGVVPAVFATIVRSSVFPDPHTPLSIIRILNHTPIIPREARRFCGIDAPIVADGVICEAVAPAAIFPRGPALGIYTQFAPAPNVPASAGDPTNEGQSFAGLYKFRTVFDTSWNTPRYLSSPFCSS